MSCELTNAHRTFFIPFPEGTDIDTPVQLHQLLRPGRQTLSTRARHPIQLWGVLFFGTATELAHAYDWRWLSVDKLLPVNINVC